MLRKEKYMYLNITDGVTVTLMNVFNSSTVGVYIDSVDTKFHPSSVRICHSYAQSSNSPFLIFVETEKETWFVYVVMSDEKFVNSRSIY